MDDKIKVIGLILLCIVAVALAAYFLLMPAPVDKDTFANIFYNATTIAIVSDVRGVTDNDTSHNILQCQVDFASSSGMGGKNVSYFSIGAEGCFSTDGKHPDDYCLSQNKNDVTIYIRQGNTTSFFSNGVMAVGVDNVYKLGTCGIKRV